MSETRSYFSYRYAVSGFIFILLIFLINLDVISKNLPTDTTNTLTINLSAVVAIFTFLAGPSIGFIIAQFWYFVFDICDIQRRFWNVSRQALMCNHIITPNQWNNKLWVAKVDFWIYQKKDKEAKFGSSTLNYLVRRWDLFNTLNCTAFSIFLGLPIGYGIFLFICDKLNSPIILSSSFIHYNFFIIFASIASIIVSVIGAWKIRNEHQNMILSILNNEPKFQPLTLKAKVITLVFGELMLISAFLMTRQYFDIIGIISVLCGLLIMIFAIILTIKE